MKMTALMIPAMLVLLSACSNIGGSSDGGELAKMPSKLWEGGSLLTIRTKSNQPSVLKANFYRSADGVSGSDSRRISVAQSIPPGEKSLLVSVPTNVGGYVELGVPNATPGATITCSLETGGKEIWTESYTLEQPLKANEAAFVNVDIENFSKAELANDE